jgi:hypothetical protein
MAGRPLRPPRPPSEDWRRTAGSDSDASDDSYSSDSSDEEAGPARDTHTQRRGCCGKAPAEPPPDAAPEKQKEKEREKESLVKLPRSLRRIAAVHEDEVPTTLWPKPSRALALERAEAHQPRFKVRLRRLCALARAARRGIALAALNRPRPAPRAAPPRPRPRRPPTGGGTHTTCCRRRRSRLGAPSALVTVRSALVPLAVGSAASVCCGAAESSPPALRRCAC